ncbi:MAG: hypothetical protein MUC39_02265 [Candidatus Omnitrophica bacterium]|jgi:hypothetical protein|nr:hypothetical protein [Candidatus Omnitrophota bacterium]
MKNIVLLFLILNFLSGCASYKYQKSQSTTGNTVYLVARDDKVIPEYTIGPDKTYPDLKVAQERFKRRRGMVEYYYKNMNYIMNRFHEGVDVYGGLILGMATAPFRTPFVAVGDYRYNHNPQYKEKVDAIYAKEDADEEARIAKLKVALNDYMQKDFALEEKKQPTEK